MGLIKALFGSGQKASIALRNQGVDAAARGDLGQAIAHFTAAMEAMGSSLSPQYLSLFIDRAMVWRLKGRPDMAIADCNWALGSGLQFPIAYVIRGEAHIDKGEYNLGLDDLSVAIALEPQNADAYVSRGTAYNLARDPDKAIADFTNAIKIRPGLAMAYHNRGYAHFLKGDLEKAALDYTEVIRLDPNFAKATSEAALAKVKDPKLVEAVKSCQGARFIDLCLTPEGRGVAVILVDGMIQFLEAS